MPPFPLPPLPPPPDAAMGATGVAERWKRSTVGMKEEERGLLEP